MIVAPYQSYYPNVINRVQLYGQGYSTPNVTEYPDVETPFSEKKSRKYCLQYAQAFYTDCMGNIFSVNVLAEIVRRRMYARGAQNVSQYLDRILIPSGVNAITVADLERRVRMTLTQEPIKLLPARLEAMAGMIVPARIVPIITANDAASILERTKIGNRVKGGFSVMKNNPVMAQIADSVGVPLLPPKMHEKVMTGEVSTLRDVEEELNEFRLDIEEATEKSISATFYQLNDWRSESNTFIQRLQVDGLAVIRPYINSDYGVTTRVTDTVNLVMKLPMTKDGSDVEAIGERRYMTIYDLKQLDIHNEYTDNDYKTVLASFASNDTGYGAAFTTQQLQVLDMEWTETIKIPYSEYYAKNQKREKLIDPSNPIDKDRPKREPKYVHCEVVFQAIWVVGTEIIVNYGIKPGQVRGDSGQFCKADKGFIISCPSAGDSTNPRIESLVGNIITIVNKYQMASSQIEIEFARAPMATRLYAQETLQAIQNSLKLEHFTDAIKVIETLGRGILPPQDPKKNLSGMPTPQFVTDISSGVDYEKIQYLSSQMQQALMDLADVMGLPQGFNAQSPDINQAVGTQKMLAGSVSARLSEYNIALESATKRTMRQVAKMSQQIVTSYKKGEIKSTPYVDILTAQEEDNLTLLDKYAQGKYTFDYQQSLSEQEYQEELALLNAAIQAGSITYDEVVFVKNQTRENPVKAARLVKALREKRERQAQANQEKIQQINQEGNAKSAEIAAQAQKDLLLETQKFQIEMEKLKHKQKMQELEFQRDSEMLKQGLITEKELGKARINQDGIIDKEIIKTNAQKEIDDKWMEHEKSQPKAQN